VSVYRAVEVYGAFMRISGEIEVLPPQRLTDVVNHLGDYLELRAACTEPLSVNHPVLSKRSEHATVAKSSIVLLCPRDPLVLDDDQRGFAGLRREKERVPMAITTGVISMIADVHLEPRHTLRDHLERYRGDFLPLTNLSALWVGSAAPETLALQRAFALLNPASILTFATRD
jgi:hypothetical protein